ncbi:homeobox domain containing protein [Diplodia corticola]|uniref:Homeobox domain containing protein n=1 Tax=Diplodia corticola TaxID=236234 RepID=A0A1J9QRZ8_9PEZI|nr:homeobox domain containing protein [Diplodia corticola]OJD31224.1 homeobox domain containing protein [Diplodia corticola]
MNSEPRLSVEQPAMPNSPACLGEASDPPVTNGEQEMAELGKVSSNDEEPKELQMQRWWQESITKVMGVQNGYKNVHVLMVKWERKYDQLRVHSELSELKAVFEDKYGYATKTIELSLPRNPQMQLTNAISGFIVENDDPQNLLIVYYAGHGIFHDDGKRLELAGSDDPDEAVLSKVFWNEVQTLFVEHAAGDVLAIMDCCFASNLMSRAGRKVNSRAFELLAASTIDKITESPGDKSFTRALIRCLTELAEQRPPSSDGTGGDGSFDMHELSQHINRVRTATPCQLWGVLKGNRRHIRLTPQRAREEQEQEQERAGPREQPWTFDPPGGLLSLQFILGERELARETIRNLARQLPDVFKANEVRLRNVRWLDFERPKMFPRFTGILLHGKRMGSIGRKRKASSTPVADQSSDGVLGGKKRRSLGSPSDLRTPVDRRMQLSDQDGPTSGDESVG